MILLVSSNSCEAQEVLSRKEFKQEMVSDGALIDDSALNKFIGKYTWQQGSDKLTVEFSKVAMPTRMAAKKKYSDVEG